MKIRNGFSLVEMLIALVIISISALSLATLQVTNIKTISIINAMANANVVAEKHIVEMQHKVSRVTPTETTTIEINDAISYTSIMNIATIDTDVMKLSSTINWEQYGSEFTVALTTVIPSKFKLHTFIPYTYRPKDDMCVLVQNEDDDNEDDDNADNEDDDNEDDDNEDDGNNGHGNDDDGVDESNPGKSKKNDDNEDDDNEDDDNEVTILVCGDSLIADSEENDEDDADDEENDGNNGHGNDDDGIDESNPGKSKKNDD